MSKAGWFVLTGAAALVGFFALGLSGAGKIELRKIVQAGLRDGESAEFSGDVLYTHADGKRFLCGQVNAKNGFGAYVGYRDFIASDNFALVDDPSNSVVSGALQELREKNCHPD